MSADNIKPLTARKRGRPRKDSLPVDPAALPAERIGWVELRQLTHWGVDKIETFIERGDHLKRRLPTYLDYSRMNRKRCPVRFWLRTEVLAFMAALTERYQPRSASAARSA